MGYDRGKRGLILQEAVIYELKPGWLKMSSKADVKPVLLAHDAWRSNAEKILLQLLVRLW